MEPSRLEPAPSGRVVTFAHYPGSPLPLRDFRTRTEPHIEVGAHSYVKPVSQAGIRSFCRSRARYLFLAARCRYQPTVAFFGRQFIVGYIRRFTCLKLRGHLTVVGQVYIVPFDARLDLTALSVKPGQAVAPKVTTRLLRLIHRHRNQRDTCVRAMVRLESIARRTGVPVAADQACLDRRGKCELHARCRRKRLSRR